MSALYVRDQFKQFLLEKFPSENFIDLTGQFGNIQEFIEDSGITRNDNWIGLEFLGDDEVAVGLAADHEQGCYREFGVVVLHIVDIAAIGVGQDIVLKAESIRNTLRGRRINDIIINSVSPPDFRSSSTLQFESGYIGASISANYQYTFNITQE